MRRNRRRNKRRGVNYRGKRKTEQGRIIKQRNVDEEKEREDTKAE